MIESIKLSIIIPVYNTEKFIAKTLRSCINQDVPLSEYEIIIVNDGTKDNSMSVVSDITNGLTNIIVVNQENKGLSAARNTGLNIARGEYVWFIDSDDWISEKCLNSFLMCLKDCHPEAIFISAANVINTVAQKRYDIKDYHLKIFSGIELASKHLVQVCAPFTIYNKSYLLNHNFKFKEGILHEDIEFTTRTYYSLNKILIYNELLYYVRQNESSITRFVTKKNVEDLLFVAESVYHFKQNVNREYGVYLNRVIRIVFNSILLLSQSFDSNFQKKVNDKIIENKFLLDSLLNNYSLVSLIEWLLFRISFHKIVETYGWINRCFMKHQVRRCRDI